MFFFALISLLLPVMEIRKRDCLRSVMTYAVQLTELKYVRERTLYRAPNITIKPYVQVALISLLLPLMEIRKLDCLRRVMTYAVQLTELK